jgi:hypothetical protein
MDQLTQTTEKEKQSSRFSVIKPGSFVKSFLKLSIEWQILFALLALMGLRLVTIIAMVLKQL